MSDNLSNLLSFEESSEIYAQTEKNVNESLSSFKIENFETEFFGFLGEYYRLICQGTKGTKAEYFLKSIPIKDEADKRRVQRIGVFQKETSLYKTLIKDFDKYVDKLPTWHCKCYLAKEELLVFENLKLQGYSSVNENEKFTEDNLYQTLVSLASMHATSVIFEEITGEPISKKYGQYLEEKNFLKESNGWWTAGINLIIAIASQHPDYQSREYQEYFENKFQVDLDQIYEILKSSKKYKNTFCHRDIWGQNILFKGDSCIFVDFQNCRYCPPAIDFLMVLHSNTQCRVEREQLKEKCLKFYYKHLERFCSIYNVPLQEKIMSYEQFIESCNFVLLLPLVVDAVYKPLTKTPPGLLAEIKAGSPSRYVNLCEVDRIDFVLEIMEKDLNYKNVMNEIVEDIILHLYSNKKQIKSHGIL